MEGFLQVIKKKWHIPVLVALIILLSYPALFTELAKGHDLDFHLQRIEGLLSDLSKQNFPVRLQSKWVDGYGCPISIFYGDILLYIAVIFRKLGLSIMGAYRVFLVCINSATVIISYYSFKTYFKDKSIAVVSTILYSTAAYRLVDVYVRAALGETLSITFFPAVAACVYVIISEKDRKKRLRASLFLALSLSAIICTHVLTTSMLLVVLIPTCVVAIFVFRKGKERFIRLIELFLSGVGAVLLSAFYVVPFLDFYLFGDIKYPESHNIQAEGLGIRDFFSFFANPFSVGDGDIQKTPGIALMLCLIGAIIYLIYSLAKKKRLENRKRMLFTLVCSLVLLFMTTCYFPWNFVEKNVPLGELLTSIEFPMRYLTFAILFMTLLSGDLLGVVLSKSPEISQSEQTNRVFTVVCVIISVMCVFNVVNYCVYNERHEKKAVFKTEEDLGRWIYYSMDYQLEGTTIDDVMPTDIKTEGLLSFELVSKQGTDHMMAVVTGPDYGWIQLPMFNYKYYHAEDVEDSSIKFELHDGSNRTIGVLLPANYVGICHVYWKEPVLWRVAEVISLITLLAILIALFNDKICLFISHFGEHGKGDAV